MKKEMDKIQFEYRYEVQELMKVIDKYVKEGFTTYVVCVKQVPDTANVEVDPVTGVLKRDGAQSKLNPYDLYAMESSLGMKERRMGE